MSMDGCTPWTPVRARPRGRLKRDGNQCRDRTCTAPISCFGSQDSALYCVSADRGVLVWKYSIDDQIRCTPTVVDDRAFVAGCDSKLHIIDLTNGQPVGKVDIQAPTGVTPAVAGEHVFFAPKGVCSSVSTGSARRSYGPLRTNRAGSRCAAPGGRGGQSRLRWSLQEGLLPQRQDGNIVVGVLDETARRCRPVIVQDRRVRGRRDGGSTRPGSQHGQERLDKFEAGGGFTGSPFAVALPATRDCQRGTASFYCLLASKSRVSPTHERPRVPDGCLRSACPDGSGLLCEPHVGPAAGDAHRFGLTAYAIRLLHDVYFLEWCVEEDVHVAERQMIGTSRARRRRAICTPRPPGGSSALTQP